MIDSPEMSSDVYTVVLSMVLHQKCQVPPCAISGTYIDGTYHI